MSHINNVSEKAHFFEGLVIESFGFLENEFNMSRGKVRILNPKDPREVTARIRYESDSHRIDVGWGISENGIGILIWSKLCRDDMSIPKDKCYVYFEPFVEYLTNGFEKPISPQVYPKMSVSKILKIMDERRKLFELPLPEIVRRLAIKMKSNFELILSKDIKAYIEFHEWLAVQG